MASSVSDGAPLTKNNVTVTGNTNARQSMVFLHGFGTDQGAWQDIVPAFRADYRIILLDNMGSGHSDRQYARARLYINLHDYARDLLDVCEALNLKDAVFVGHSAGSMIGVLAANEKPGLFRKMVLIGASPRYLDDEGYHGGFTKSGLESLYQAVTLQYDDWAKGFASLAMGNPDRPFLAEQFARSIIGLGVNPALSALNAIFQSDHREDIKKISKPTLLIQALEDIAVPREVAEYLHLNIPGSCLAVINATGHLPHISAPTEVIAAIRAFL